MRYDLLQRTIRVKGLGTGGICHQNATGLGDFLPTRALKLTLYCPKMHRYIAIGIKKGSAYLLRAGIDEVCLIHTGMIGQ
jgi:hypothetical protein